MNHFYITPAKYLSNSERKVRRDGRIKKFVFKAEPENQYDSNAIAVYKIKGKNNQEIKIGYLRRFEYIFTERANMLYNEWIESDYDNSVKMKEGWGGQDKLSLENIPTADYFNENIKNMKFIQEYESVNYRAACKSPT